MHDQQRLLLDDVLVVELGNRIAVGACGSLLSHLGARVVAVEPRDRSTSGKWGNRAAMMAGKSSIVLDSADRHDRALQAELLARADVVLLSSDCGDATNGFWGAAADAHQIVVDITAFGRGDTDEARDASDEVVQALGGVVDTTGLADGAPAVVGTPVLEMTTAVSTAAAVLLALRVRRLHGFGQCIDISILDGAVSCLTNFFALHFGGIRASRSGNRHPIYSPWGSHIARDGHLLLCAVSDDQFARLCRAIGEPGLAQDPRFSSSPLRRQRVDELDQFITAWAASRTVVECEQAMIRAGVPCGPIVTLDMLEREPNLVHREMVRRSIDPETASSVRVPASPIRGTALPIVNSTCIPGRDEDRAAVLQMLAARAKPLAHTRVTNGPVHLEALAGVRVVEVGHYTVAPLASRYMGAFGADVIKVEPPQGDAIRQGVPRRDNGVSYIFALSNTDKRGLVLDLRHEDDKARLHRLLEQSDLLIENLRPGTLEKLGFGPEVLRARHPHLVYCAITGFGSDSTYRDRPALDTVIQAMSGIMSLTCVDGTPTKAGISVSDVTGGLFGLLASLAGIEYRDRTGRAPHFDISMQDASVWMTQMRWAAGSRSNARVVKASDGYVVVAAGDAPLKQPEQPATRAELVAFYSARGVEAAPVLTVTEVVESPRTAARRLIVECVSSDNHTWWVHNCPLQLCSTPPRVRTVMSRLGLDDDQVINELRLDRRPNERTP